LGWVGLCWICLVSRPYPDLTETLPRAYPAFTQALLRPYPDLTQTLPRPYPDLSVAMRVFKLFENTKCLFHPAVVYFSSLVLFRPLCTFLAPLCNLFCTRYFLTSAVRHTAGPEIGCQEQMVGDFCHLLVSFWNPGPNTMTDFTLFGTVLQPFWQPIFPDIGCQAHGCS
jgi:hypothetical protein